VISKRIEQIAFSSTVKVNQKARELRAQGVDILDLSAGEPDFNTPEYIKQAAKEAIDNDFTRYTAVAGLPEVRQVIADYLRNSYRIDYSLDEIIISNGVKHALYNLFMALLDPGDEVIIPAPYWVSYPEQVKLAGGIPVFVDTDESNDFLLTPENLKSAITAGSKALVLCNPSNPTGTMYEEEQLRPLAEICVRHNIMIISDEIYSRLVYNGHHFISIAALSDQIKKYSVVLNGVSKTFAMTGWRIGFAAGPRDLIAAMGKVQSHNSSNSCTVSQMATKTALSQESEELSEMCLHFENRGKYLMERLAEMPGIECVRPMGGFSAFPNILES